MERESAAGHLVAQECPLELSLATEGAQGSSSSTTREGTVQRRRRASARQARSAWSVQAPSMSALYAELRALLPGVPSSGRRPTREEILDAAVAHVKVLEDTAAVLEAYRGVRSPVPGPPPPPRCPDVAVLGPAVCFSARLPAPGPGALRRVLEAFERHGVQVLAANLARPGRGASSPGAVADAVVTVTAAAAPPEVLEMVRADIACIR